MNTLRIQVRSLAEYVPATLVVQKIQNGYELSGLIDDLNDYLYANAMRRELNLAKVLDTSYDVPTFV